MKNEIDGLLLVDKPTGLTSHDVVALVRRHFHLKKVGHTGTLDPLATGLLVLTIGKGTKLTQELISQSKDYEATLQLGATSDTQDTDGKILELKDCKQITEKDLLGILPRFTGELEQIPPMFSAIKKQGKKLYELARKGIVVDRPPKKITIYDLRINKIEIPFVDLFISCSKGTYIRTLCHDMGDVLNCGGLLSALRRTRSGSFYLKDAYTLHELMKCDLSQLNQFLIPLEELPLYASSETPS